MSKMTEKSTIPLYLSLEESIPFLTILTIIGVTSIATNLLIVCIICKNSRLRKIHDLFTLHSSLVDLLTASIVVPFWILSAIHSQIYFVGEVYCKPERMKRDDSMKKRCERYALRGGERTTQKAYFSILIIHTFCWAPYTCVALVQTMTGGKVFYLGNVPVHFIALVIGLTGTTLKGVVSCFEVPHLKELIKKQFGCTEREENEENTTLEV
ncbi:hypothetical protein ACROYT_G010785 [Oculina patagonica]